MRSLFDSKTDLVQKVAFCRKLESHEKLPETFLELVTELAKGSQDGEFPTTDLISRYWLILKRKDQEASNMRK